MDKSGHFGHRIFASEDTLAAIFSQGVTPPLRKIFARTDEKAFCPPLVPLANAHVGSQPLASGRTWSGGVLVRTPRGANGRVGRRGGQAPYAEAGGTIRRRTARFPIGFRWSNVSVK